MNYILKAIVCSIIININSFAAIDLVPCKIPIDSISDLNLKSNGGSGGIVFNSTSIHAKFNGVDDTCHVIRKDSSLVVNYWEQWEDSLSCNNHYKDGFRANGSIIKYSDEEIDFEISNSDSTVIGFQKREIQTYYTWGEDRKSHDIFLLFYSIFVIGSLVAMIYGASLLIK